MIIWTDEQESIFSQFSSGTPLAVDGVAGCAKTTTLKESLKRSCATTYLALAFNKKNAEDLKKDLPEAGDKKTFNGLGHGAWMRHINRAPELDSMKSWKLLPEEKGVEKLSKEEKGRLVKLISIAKSHGISSGFAGSGKPDMDLWGEIASQFDIDEDDFGRFSSTASQMLYKSTEQAFSGLIDFDDQIYMPVMFRSSFPKYPKVVVDETQDLNGMQHIMVGRCMEKDSQLGIFGDPNQAIYAFRGAKADSFSILAKKFNLTYAPLHKSFRVPLSVAREAQRYVPHLEAHSTRPGSVHFTTNSPNPSARLTVLCRTNAPLMRLATQSIKSRIAVNYLGRDFMTGLKALHKKYPSIDLIHHWRDQEIKKSKSTASKARIEDRADALITLHLESKALNLPMDLILSELTNTPKGNAFTLSTIHKAKGLEWDNVFYLDYGKEWSGVQEDNIKYVGVTRAKENLVLQGDDDWYDERTNEIQSPS